MGLPFRAPVPPMLAQLARELPVGDFLYEPKWDGFRSLAFRDGAHVDMRSRHQSLFSRYFPELVEGLLAIPDAGFVLDGEIVVLGAGGFDFGALLNRVHPSASRVERLRHETPAAFMAFDVLAAGGADLRERPYGERRTKLEELLADVQQPIYLTPCTDEPDVAAEWLERFTGQGIDGVVAKHRRLCYEPGRRAMVKVKRERTVECVVAGFRLHGDRAGVASLLLGLHDANGELRHVGVASSFTETRRRELYDELSPLVTGLAGHPWERGFGMSGRPMGRLRGAAGVWTPELTQDWVPVRVERVCEVAYVQVDADRFRHPARFLRWRPDREPASCGFEQLEVGSASFALAARGAVFEDGSV